MGEKNKNFIPVYLDIMATTCLKDFSEMFGKAVLSAIGRNEAMMKKVLKRLSALRLKLTIDHLTGEPSLSFDVNNNREAELSLETIFRYLADQPHRIAIAIDEFQQITNYPEKNLEAILRTHLQTVNNVSIIFSGSRKHILTDIFSSPDRPFYNITEMMEITTIVSETIWHLSDQGSAEAIFQYRTRRWSGLQKLQDFTHFMCSIFVTGFIAISEKLLRMMLTKH